MKLSRFNNASQFYERVKSYLLQHEAHHCLLLGLSDTLIRHSEHFIYQPYLVAVVEDDKPLAVALQTPPRKLVLSRVENFQALIAIAQDLHLQQAAVPAVIGPDPEARAFAEAWQTLTGQSYRKGRVSRIYQLETVQSIPRVSGYFRQATAADRDLLISWFKAFTEEAIDEPVEQDTECIVDDYLRDAALYLWQGDVPVSMAAYNGPTPNGIRINWVYTPPEYRRKGYASSCIAALSQTLLDEGRKYCFLFTDLANPTSNHIYQTIGYQPVGDVTDYWFQGSN